MKLRKSKVSLAIAASLGMACVTNAFGYAVETAGPNAGTVVSASSGDTLLFPFYTVENGAISEFTVINTSSIQTVVAKLRIREQKRSMDVFDMIIVLSPSDRFDFHLSKDGENGRPAIHWTDNSCVIANAGDVRNIEFAAPVTENPFVDTADQMNAGHIEILGMADIGGTVLASFAKHGANGVPANCENLRTLFANPRLVNRLNTQFAKDGDLTDEENFANGNYGPLADVDNVLVGRYTIVTNRGRAGGEAVAIRDTNFANPASDVLNPPSVFCPTQLDTRWRITAQQGTPCYPDPNLGIFTTPGDENCRTQNLAAWDQQEHSHPHLGEMRNLGAFEQALNTIRLSGEWSNELIGGNLKGTDWVIGFPTRYAYIDFKDISVPADNVKEWVLLQEAIGQTWSRPGTGVVECNTADYTWTDADIALDDALVPRISFVGGGYGPGFGIVSGVDSIIYDSEEQRFEPELEPIVSPIAIPADQLHFEEINVFSFQNQALGDDRLLLSAIQDNNKRMVIPFDLPDATQGWVDMVLRWRSPTMVQQYNVRVIDIDDDILNIPGQACELMGGTPDPNVDDYFVDLYPSDGVCDNLYSAFLPISTPVDCARSPLLCTPKGAATTGLLFATQVNSVNPVDNDATVSELHRPTTK